MRQRRREKTCGLQRLIRTAHRDDRGCDDGQSGETPDGDEHARDRSAESPADGDESGPDGDRREVRTDHQTRRDAAGHRVVMPARAEQGMSQKLADREHGDQDADVGGVADRRDERSEGNR